MEEEVQTLRGAIRKRRSTRSFTNAVPPPEGIEEILQSAIFAPFGRPLDLPASEIRKIFVFSQGTASMARARELLHMETHRLARKVRIVTSFLPFLKKKMGLFSKRISAVAENGIPGLSEAPYYVIVAVKKGFPAMEKQTIAHAMQNMWLSATSQGLGFQLLSTTGIMSKNEEFMQLLGLRAGEYEVDGCIIGFAKVTPEPLEERHVEDFVTWIR